MILRSFFLLLFFYGQNLFGATFGSPVGYWQLADKNGNPVTLIYIREAGNTLVGKIIDYLPNKNARCTKCEGKLKDMPLRGLTVIQGLKKMGASVWSDGKMFDPFTGKYTDIKLTVLNNGSAIKISSTELLSLFSGSDIWTRRN